MRNIRKVAIVLIGILFTFTGFANSVTISQHTYLGIDQVIGLYAITTSIPNCCANFMEFGFGVTLNLTEVNPSFIARVRAGFAQGVISIDDSLLFTGNVTLPFNPTFAFTARGMVLITPFNSKGYYLIGLAPRICSNQNFVVLLNMGAGMTFSETQCQPCFRRNSIFGIGIICLDRNYNQMFATLLFRESAHLNVDFGILFSF